MADAPVARNEEPLLGLDPEGEKFAKALLAKCVLSSLSQPITVSRVLIQLGHEPFPLSTGKAFIFAGRNAYFLPNVFSYMKQFANINGWPTLWTGLDSALVGICVNGIVNYHTERYINTHYKNIGGEPENEGKDECDLTDHQSFKRVFRQAIRDSVVRTVASIVSRPLTVVMIRQIAQLIGNEAKYGTTVSSLKLIGNEEGPAGLFAGFVPQVIGDLVVVWGVHMLTYGMTRLAIKSDIGNTKKTDEKEVKAAKDLQGFIKTAVPFVVNSYGYPYGVVSTVMAVAGSGLAVSFLPYSPSFLSWHNAWDYLYPFGLKRGAKLFLREQVGAVTVGPDQQLFASNSHFV